MKKKRILLGITGSIAAYKALEVARRLVKEGYVVDVVTTEAASSFVTPLSFSALINGEVYSDDSEWGTPFAHLELGKRADLVLICPATANTLNKIANGIADNLLTSVLIAVEKPGIICPAMNASMLYSEQVQESLRKLESLGWRIILGGKGELACGDVGEGRLAEIEDIIATVKEEIDLSDTLREKKFLITSGPTREWIDNVRYISNASSGRMGSYLASEAKKRGAEVVFITGPAPYIYKRADKLIMVETAEELKEKTENEFKSCDVLIMAAAVSDFTPKTRYSGKIKKSDSSNLVLELKKNPDILEFLGKKKGKRIVVGFSLESENLEENAVKKMLEKNLDMIVANPSDAVDAEFVSAIIIKSDEKIFLENVSKRQLASVIIRNIASLLKK